MIYDDVPDVSQHGGEVLSHERAHALGERGRRLVLLEERFERPLELERRAIAIARIASERLTARGRELRRNFGNDLFDRGFAVGDARLQRGHVGLPCHPPAARDGFPQHDADRVDIAPRVGRLRETLLGRCVAKLSLDDALLRQRDRARCLGDAEIQELHLARGRDEDVGRAHVAMNDAERRTVEIAELVRVVQPREHLRQDPHVLDQREFFAAHSPHELKQRLPLEILHRQVVIRVLGDDFVGVDDVRMIESQRDARLIHEHRQEIVIGRELGPNLLDDDELGRIERASLQSQVHLGHTALAQRRHELMTADRAVFLQT